MADFEKAAAMVGPLARGRFSVHPNVKWDEVGGLLSVKKALDDYIINPINNPKDNEGFGVQLRTCILLYGPPGCGKTKVAEAVANKAGANFIPVKGLAMLIGFGNSIKTIFDEARACAPCMLFFDQVDAFSIKCGEEGGLVYERLLSQLQTELDRVEENCGVYVIGATNRPDLVDETLLRRFGKLLYVPLPSPEERGLILKAVVRKRKIDPTVDLMHLGKDACNKISGADLLYLMNEAAMAAAEDASEDKSVTSIKKEHFQRALEVVSPSVTEESMTLCKNFF